MMRKCGKKKLTRLILAALLSTGGLLFSASSVVSAVELTEADAPDPTAKGFTTGTGAQGDDVYYFTGADKELSILGGDWTAVPPANPFGFAAQFSPDSDVSEGVLVIKGNPTINNTVYGGLSKTGSANNNTVYINGDITGGAINYIWGGYGVTEASGNIVTIDKDAVLNENTRIYVGQADTANNNTVNILKDGLSVKHISNEVYNPPGEGNKLNINAINVTVGDEGIQGFQEINFYIPEGAAGKTMLTVTAKSELTGEGVATDLKGVTIGAAVQAGAKFVKGDTVNLITNPSGLTTDATTTMKQITDETVTIQTKPTAKTLTTDQSYKLELAQTADEKTITATVKEINEEKNDERTDPEKTTVKSLVETRAATTTFVNAGADMLSSQGFAQAANAVALETAAQAKNGSVGAPAASGFTPFAAFGGSSLRAESGSYVDTKGFGLNIGFAREIANSQGKLLFGPVVEYGGGNYDSYLDNGTHGEGGAHYFGIGLMARQVNHDGFYYEGSLRGGRVTSDYKSWDVIARQKVEYDSSSNYFAAHLGVGKAINVGGSNTLDAYLRYFYSHQAGDDATVKLDGVDIDRASFDAVDSNRIRIGARLTHKVNEMNSFYGGLAYQYEFSGEARAHFIDGTTAPSPSVKGSSGLLELGWQVKPGEGPLTLDLGVTGWAGKQRGGSVQLGATWSF